MIIRNLDQLAGTDRDVRGEGWRSRRLLRRDDQVNFSLHLTELDAGTELELEYANHFEANFCISGEGESSRRLLRRDDQVNFSLHLTELDAGTELELEYANHFEANFCISGEG